MEVAAKGGALKASNLDAVVLMLNVVLQKEGYL